MRVDDTVLMAYVDGNLPPERRAEVEAAVAHSVDLAERLAAMRASVLPYCAAFDRKALAPVPPELVRRVNELASVSANAHGQTRRRASVPWLAAAFFAGVFSSGAALKLLPAELPGLSWTASGSPWIQAVANYQDLYARQTLANIAEDREASARVVGDVRHFDGMPVSVPDLRNAGLTFKRVQRLEYDKKPLVQIVYLPERGGPVALCIVEDARRDEGPRAQQIGDMKIVAWRHGQLGYALLSKDSQLDLLALGQRIAIGDDASLYGKG